MNEDDELTMRSELCDQKKLKEYGQYEAYQKLMESFKARDQPVEYEKQELVKGICYIVMIAWLFF